MLHKRSTQSRPFRVARGSALLSAESPDIVAGHCRQKGNLEIAGDGQPYGGTASVSSDCRFDIEHRLFCHITQTWRGKPLTSRETVVDLIASTTTRTGLTVRCELDTRDYPKGIKVSDAEMMTLTIKGDTFHPEWNYTISPRVPI